MPLRVSDIMTPEVVVIYPNDTLSRARNLMLRHNISRLVVVNEELKPIGILTETDIASKVWEESGKKYARTIDEILVSEVMSKPVITIGPRTYIKNAAKVMIKKKISGLPVADSSNNLLGIITKTDLTKAYANHYKQMLRVKDVMSSPVITVHPMHTIYRVGRLMKENNISRVIVTDGKVPVGIITKTDLTFIQLTSKPRRVSFKKVVEGEGAIRRAVKIFRIPIVADIMTENPISINTEEDLAEAAKIMTNHGISGLPVIDNKGFLKGIVTKTDIIKAIAKLKPR